MFESQAYTFLNKCSIMYIFSKLEQNNNVNSELIFVNIFKIGIILFFSTMQKFQLWTLDFKL